MIKYSLFLYSPNGTLVGEILNAETIEYSEKDNDFGDLVITLITNNLDDDIYNNLTLFSGIKLYRESNSGGITENRLIFSGVATSRPVSKVDGSNVETYTITFKHFGKVFATTAEINKNYTAPTDEALIASNIVLYSQTPDSLLAITGGVFTAFQADFGYNTVITEETGNLTTFDFSKSVKVFDALKQVCDLESDKKKYFKFSPHLENPRENEFEFKSELPAYTGVVYSGVKSKTIKPSNVYQNIVSLNRSSSEPFNVVIAQGDGIQSTVVTANTSLLNQYKARIKRVQFKNVNQPSKLELLALKELAKSENPVEVLNLEIIPNDPSIGTFGVGAYVKVEWIDERSSNQSINDFYRVYELKITIDNMGVEKMAIQIAKSDYDDSIGGVRTMINIIKNSQKTLDIITRT